MATKIEMIKALGDAANRVIKKAVDTAAIMASLDAAQAQLEKAKGAVSSGLADFDLLYKHMYGCRCTLESIYNGYPMVPAEKSAAFKADFEKRWGGGAKKEMSPDDFVAHAVAELEKAAGEEKDEAIKRVGTVKAALLMWEDLPEGQNLLPVTVIENTKEGATSDKIDATTAGAAAFAKSADRLAAVAKGDDPGPSDKPAQPLKPVTVHWEPDLAGRRTNKGRR
jgi:hypothetical protein